MPSTGRRWRLFRVLRQNLTRFAGFADEDGDYEEADGVVMLVICW